MTVAARKNLRADYGTNFALSIRFKDSTGTPVNLTGHIATLSLFTPGKENNTPLFTYVADVTNDGWILFDVVDEATALWPVKKLAYNISLETPAGDVSRLLFGALEVRSGVAV